jgi:superoxide dismutase
VQGKQAELAAIQLPYGFKALEPHIDAKTMELHVSTAAEAAEAETEAAVELHRSIKTMIRFVLLWDRTVDRRPAHLETCYSTWWFPIAVLHADASRCHGRVAWQPLDGMLLH